MPSKPTNSYNAMQSLFTNRPAEERLTVALTELAQAKKIMDKEPTEAMWKTTYAKALERCGDLYLELHQHAQATSHFKQALELLDKGSSDALKVALKQSKIVHQTVFHPETLTP